VIKFLRVPALINADSIFDSNDLSFLSTITLNPKEESSSLRAIAYSSILKL